MSETQYEEDSLKIYEKPSQDIMKYHYSPVQSDCMACARRTTSRRHKELLEAKKSDILCGPFPSSEDFCYTPKAIAKEKYRKAELRVVTTNRRIKVFGKWTEKKLLEVVTDRLLQRAKSSIPRPCEKIPPLEIKSISARTPYDPIIHRGFYSEGILRQLYYSGASESVLIRAMKFGLRHLEPEYLNYFVQFGVSIAALRSRKLWKELIDESLIVSLRTMGFDEKSSRKIILTGMLAQNEVCLMQLMLAGVDVPGILNWQGAKIEVGVRMIKFLRKLGVDEDTLQLIVQKGVDEETNEMLKDLGYMETEAEEHPGMHEVVVCECDLTILEPKASSVISQTRFNDDLNSSAQKFDYGKENPEAEDTSCACLRSWSSFAPSSDLSLVPCEGIKSAPNSLGSSELLEERIDYLRRTVMVPLAWAMARALRYRPSDPKHYIACQLVRWRHGGISKTEIKETEDFVIARTVELDEKLMDQRRMEETELLQKRDAEIVRNILCHPCWERQQIHRVKERCWKCVRKWIPNYEPCEFQGVCSSCKINFSDIVSSDSSTTSAGDISSATEVGKEITSPHRRSYVDVSESSSYRRDYNAGEESLDSSFYGGDGTASDAAHILED